MVWRRIRRLSGRAKQVVDAPWVIELATDARPADGRASRRRGQGPDPEEERLRRLRRRAARLVVGALVVAGLLTALVAKGGYLDMRRLQAERQVLLEEIAEANAVVESLEAEVEALESSSLALERIAREQLGYARRGEHVYLLADPE